jgi:putative membrane protein
MYRGGRGGHGFGPRAGIGAGVFARGVLLRFLLGIALLVIAWMVITWESRWGRPDGALQILRERFARGEINEEEYRKRLVALS